MKNLDAFKAHGDVIWNIANLLRGPYRPPQYRRVMIPLTVLRRLDCVLEASKDVVIKYHKQLKEQTDKDGKPKYDTETIEKMASSVEPVGELRLRKLAKHVIQGELSDSEGAKPVGFSHGHFDLVVQTLDHSTGELLFGPKVVEDQLTVAA